MTKGVRAAVATALMVLLAFTAAGCGGDDDDTAAPAGTSEETETTSGNDDDDGAVAGAFGTAECQRAALAMGQAMAGVGGATSGGTDFAEGFAAAGDQLEAAKEAAPAEIRDALDKLAEGFAAVAEKLEGVDYTPGEGAPPQEWIEAFSVFEDEDYQSASEEVSAWFEDECGAEE